MKRLAIALTAVLAACGGGDISEATTTVVDSTASTSITTTTSMSEGYDLEDLLCGATPAPPHAECSGDKTYASITLPAEAIRLGATDRVVNVLIGTLGFPTAIRARIENTRALDGTLTDDSPDGYSASWTYHPNDGLSLVVEMSS
jgi:hypothetical protein